MTPDDHIRTAEADFKNTLEHLQLEYRKLQVGRANPELVDGLLVEAYDATQPLKGLAGISVTDARTLQIQPWDAHVISNIERAIIEAKLGLNPQNDGRVIRLVFPPLSEERRKELAKKVHELAEIARVSVRNARQTAHSAFKQQEDKGEITEDDRRHAEKKLQEKVDHANKEIEDLAKKKEQDVMTV